MTMVQPFGHFLWSFKSQSSVYGTFSEKFLLKFWKHEFCRNNGVFCSEKIISGGPITRKGNTNNSCCLNNAFFVYFSFIKAVF